MSDGGLTGSARVLAILRCLGERPAGARLGEVALAVEAPKSSVHRALAALVDSGFARQDADGVYHLGFDLLQLVFGYHEAQQSSLTVEPVLRRLADATGETTHYGVLVGADIVYQAKVSPTRKTFQMSSVIGGGNPAYRTGLGKALLMHRLHDLPAVQDYVDRHGPLVARTAHTLVSADQLHAAFVEGRQRGYALDLQENDLGIVCIAFPLFLDSPTVPAGALSISAVCSRTSAADLMAQAPMVRGIISEELGERVLAPEQPTVDEAPGRPRTRPQQGDR
ncbi:IclR family transcriptional regulator [Microlunatus aurantiacus]|uniref:IclR family transcriptional regulator n=1 Tax=Microlunatus aurantiacus TaxID=446786 RepID=A0ABP7CPE9_9ACTN